MDLTIDGLNIFSLRVYPVNLTGVIYLCRDKNELQVKYKEG